MKLFTRKQPVKQPIRQLCIDPDMQQKILCASISAVGQIISALIRFIPFKKK